MIVLDTNVVSELFKPVANTAVLEFIDNKCEELATTAISVYEIHYGIARMPDGKRKSNMHAASFEFFESLTPSQILDVNEQTARRSAQYRALRAKHGKPMSINDALIAGICGEANAPLATRNTKDFEKLSLFLINPWA